MTYGMRPIPLVHWFSSRSRRKLRYVQRAGLARIMMFTVLSVTVCQPAMSEPLGADGAYFLYRVQRGDTLSALATRYMGGGEASYRVLRRYNPMANHARIVPGAVLRIPFASIPVAASMVQVVHAHDAATADHTPIQAGTKLPESATIETGAKGSVTMQFDDFTRVSAGPNTRIALARVRSFVQTRLIDVRLHLDKGEVESIVSPTKSGVGRYEISTPNLVTGVRGTRFRVQTQGGISTASVLEGEVSAATAHSSR